MKIIQGKWIDFEGIGGSGKTTQAKRLVSFLERHKQSAIFNAEPTQRYIFGRIVREIIEQGQVSEKLLSELGKYSSNFLKAAADDLAERKIFYRRLAHVIGKILNQQKLSELDRQILFLADGLCDLLGTVLPNLERGIWVIQDRYRLSTDAYGASKGLSIDSLEKWQLRSLGSKFYYGRKPDVVVFVEISPELALKRLQQSGKVLDQYETLRNLKKVDKNYRLAIAYLNTIEKGKYIHGCQPIILVNGEKSENKVFEEICRKLSKFFQGEFPRFC